MVFEEESMKDKLGRTIVFRNARPEDAGDYSVVAEPPFPIN